MDFNEKWLEVSKRHKDAVTVNTMVRFDWRDRLRLLVHGRLTVAATVFYKGKLPEEGESLAEVRVDPVYLLPRPKLGFIATERKES